jgi:dTDP-4-amino-4,6-dideoxygalactose transaminase
MAPLMTLAAQHGIHIIEDCAQSPGAMVDGRLAGSFGICSAFSFCQDKIITTGGEGGILLTDDEALWRRAWEFKDHGKSWDAVFNRSHPPGFRWLHESFGTNMRMTEIQGAIGRLQLKKLPEWLAKRKTNALALASGLETIPGLQIPLPGSGFEHAWYKLYAFLNLEQLKEDWNQSRIIEAINIEGIPCLAGGCCEIYREKAFMNAGFGPQFIENESLPAAELMFKRSLMFVVHPTLGDQELIDTVEAVRKVMHAAVKS